MSAATKSRRVRLVRLGSSAIAVCMVFASAVADAQVPMEPTAVTIAGALQQALGCSENWQPACVTTQLAFDAEDQVWQRAFDVPAGNWEYKAALDGSWTENYGANAALNGPNIPLALSAATSVKFYFSRSSNWVADSRNALIAVAAGSFQTELGCANDWDPACLRSWLQDADGDGFLRFKAALPAGSYEVKVAMNEGWDVNYGAGGVANGANIAFTVSENCDETEFVFDALTKTLSIGPADPLPQPTAVVVAGSLQQELGCAGDWQPDCAATQLSFDAGDGVWQRSFTVPAGNWEYKAPINNSWDENYGANATRNGANIALNLAAPTDVKFYFSRETNWITDDASALIATVAGSFQSEIGCAGDWDPSCLRSWLQDADGDGIYIAAARIPAGNYEVKVAYKESWTENYGQGGVRDGANIAFSVPFACGLTYFSYNPQTRLLSIGAEPGGVRGSLRQARAYWIDAETFAWNSGSETSRFTLHIDAAAGLAIDESGVTGGESIMLTRIASGLNAEQRAKFPHLAGYAAFKLPADALVRVPEFLRGQVAVSAVDAAGNPEDATGVQLPGVLDDTFANDAALGVRFEGAVPTLRLWAPTARSVALLLYANDNPSAEPVRVAMVRDAATGNWSARGSADWRGKYYLYEVEVFVPSTGAIERNRVTDPYSLSLAADSTRSQIVDLNDSALMPLAWRLTLKPALDAPEDIALYELHVRDFSIRDSTVPVSERGTFSAFARNGSHGMRHLRELARAGVTHVHLLPVFDFATVPERRADQRVVDEAALSLLPADSDQQQAAVAAIKDQDGFNWGYDPWHFTVPEGSYATDPAGARRIFEFRQMVQSLNRNGLRVVMDVVYNHTSAAGQNAKSVLDRVVPGYYHRLNADGNIESSSCCANTASEHAMMEKLLIDSVLTWARDYKVDGFRFDLMGHHSKSNLLKLRAALDRLTLARDGVDGRKIYLYGEGWNFGEVANNARFEQATQANMAGTGVGTFSDRLRDGMRGGNPFGNIREQGFMNGLATDPNEFEAGQGGDPLAELRHISDWIRVGLAGDLAGYELVNADGVSVRADQIDYFGQRAGYTADPSENIKYIEAHDNETLFDSIQLKAAAGAGLAERVRMQNLGNSVVLLGQGVPFLHAGQEFLRSKSMDRDSFNSGDWFNAIDWTFATSNWGVGLPNAEKNAEQWPLMAPLLADPARKPNRLDREAATLHVKEMLRIRHSSPLFRLRSADQIRQKLRFHNTGPTQTPGLLVMAIDDAAGELDRRFRKIVAVFNARPDATNVDVPESPGVAWKLHPVQRRSADLRLRDAVFQAAAARFNVPGRTTAVFVDERSALAQIDLLSADVAALAARGDLTSARARYLRSLLDAAAADVRAQRQSFAIVWLTTFDASVLLYTGLAQLGDTEGRALSRFARQAIASLVDD